MKPKEERDKEDAKKVPKDETSLAEKTKSGKQGNKNKGQTTPDSPQTSKEVPVCYSVVCTENAAFVTSGVLSFICRRRSESFV